MTTTKNAPRPTHSDDQLLTIKQAAVVLSVAVPTVYSWTARGIFCPGRLIRLPNGSYRVARADLLAWARLPR